MEHIAQLARGTSDEGGQHQAGTVFLSRLREEGGQGAAGNSAQVGLGYDDNADETGSHCDRESFRKALYGRVAAPVDRHETDHDKGERPNDRALLKGKRNEEINA